MKNVLILCEAFPPAYNPRMGYLCKYLTEYGWNPFVVTEYTTLNNYRNLSNIKNVTYINFHWKKTGENNKIKYILFFFAELFFNYKSRIFQKYAEKIIKNNDISVILTSVSFRAFPALCAKKLSKKYKIPFVLDCRDIYEQFPNREYSSKYFLKSKWINNMVDIFVKIKCKQQRDRALYKANAVTTVSVWHTDKLLEYNKNSYLIYNGFDEEAFCFKQLLNNSFNITYTGKIESIAVKDPTLLFESVAFMSEKKLITPEKFRVQFYLLNQSSKEIIKNMTEKYNVDDYVDVFDSVQNECLPEILNKSSILLLLANSTEGENSPKGIMGTKLYEYLGVEKPILCVRNDKSCLEETINLTKSGISASSIEEVNEFILEKYNEWLKNGFTKQNIEKQELKKFTRRYQAKQFAELFNAIIE